MKVQESLFLSLQGTLKPLNKSQAFYILCYMVEQCQSLNQNIEFDNKELNRLFCINVFMLVRGQLLMVY